MNDKLLDITKRAASTNQSASIDELQKDIHQLLTMLKILQRENEKYATRSEVALIAMQVCEETGIAGDKWCCDSVGATCPDDWECESCPLQQYQDEVQQYYGISHDKPN